MTAGGKNDKFENVAPLKSAINALAAESQGSERKDDDSLVEVRSYKVMFSYL